jgi:hypothetical protein
MRIVRKQWAFQTGYDIGTDLPFGFQLYLGRRTKSKLGEPAYHAQIFAQWDWPRLKWRSATWAVDEPGQLRGMPVMRQGGFPKRWKAWTGYEHVLSGVSWPRCLFVRIPCLSFPGFI